MVQKLEAEEGHIEMSFPYFVDKAAPVSGVQSLMDYEVTFIGEILKGERCFTMKVLVPVTSLCPCSKKISEHGAHNQRSHVTVTAHTNDFVWIEEIIDLVEKQASSELYGLLKRPDEKFVTERAYDNPKFVEDMVRDVAAVLNLDERIDALRGRVGELRVDPQPLRLRADRERQTRLASASGLVLVMFGFTARPRTSQESARGMVAEVEAMYAETRSETGLARMSPAVQRAMGKVERHRLVPAGRSVPRIPQPSAADRQRPDHLAAVHRRAFDQIFSRADPNSVVLEVGTGSGYQAAVLAEIVSRVYTIELIRLAGRTAPASGWKNSVTAISKYGSATATTAGRRRRRSTASW